MVGYSLPVDYSIVSVSLVRSTVVNYLDALCFSNNLEKVIAVDFLVFNSAEPFLAVLVEGDSEEVHLFNI